MCSNRKLEPFDHRNLFRYEVDVFPYLITYTAE